MKRSVDLVCSLLALAALSPLLLVVALLVRVNLGAPVLFRQIRLGKDAQPFELMKFRTMQVGDGADDSRLTAFGRFLRSTSLDELPELWNVVRGEMSLVGPRPLLVDYLTLYSDEQRRRHDVLPGLTGWAQINGRNNLAWPDRLALDVWYVDHQSTWLDLRILLLTPAVVLKRSGISAPDHATMKRFTA